MKDFIKKYGGTIFICFGIWLILNGLYLITAPDYDVVDYEIVYDHVVVQAEHPKNNLETIMIKPRYIYYTKEESARVDVLRWGRMKWYALYLPTEYYEEYRRVIFGEYDG